MIRDPTSTKLNCVQKLCKKDGVMKSGWGRVEDRSKWKIGRDLRFYLVVLVRERLSK